MAVCGRGHANQEGAAYCASCGLALPAQDPPGIPRAALVAGAVVVLIGLIAALVAVVVTSRTGSDADPGGAAAGGSAPGSDEVIEDLIVASTGRDAGRLYLLPAGEPIGATSSFGQGKVLPIGRLPHVEEPVPATGLEVGPGVIPVPGGAVVAWTSRGLGQVAFVRAADGRTRTIYRGSDELGVGADDLDGAVRLSIEDQGTCLVSEGGRMAALVESGASCRFERGGQILVGRDAGDGEQAFTLLDPTGSVVSSIEPAGLSAELHGGVVAVRGETGVVFADATSGRRLEEYGMGLMDRAGTTLHDGGVLVRTGEPEDAEAEEVGIDLVTGTGEVVPVASGPTASGYLGPDGTLIAGTGSWTSRSLTATAPEGGAPTKLVTAPGLEYDVAPGPDGEIRVVAWDRDGRVWFGSPTRALPEVGAIEDLRGLHGLTTVEGHDGVFGVTEQAELVHISADGVAPIPGKWAEVEVSDRSPHGVLVTATVREAPNRHRDERVLFLVSGDEVRTLDRGTIEDARFDGDDGDEVVYEWREPGAPVRTAQIHRLSVVGDPEPEVVQRGVGIALAPARHATWRPTEGGAGSWPTVIGCGSTPSVAPTSGGGGVFEEGTDACLYATAEPGELRLSISAIDASHVVIESDGRVVAERDGPFEGYEEIAIPTEGGPTMLHFTVSPRSEGGIPMSWYVEAAFFPEE